MALDLIWAEVYLAMAFLVALCLWQLLIQPRWAKRNAASATPLRTEQAKEANAGLTPRGCEERKRERRQGLGGCGTRVVGHPSEHKAREA